MSGSAVGEGVVTPHGIELIVSDDLPLDQVTTDQGHTYRWEDVRAVRPPEERTAEAVQAWLVAPWQLVTSNNIRCSCSCGQCSFLVVVRGSTKVTNHQRDNDACTCGKGHECCGLRLDLL